MTISSSARRPTLRLRDPFLFLFGFKPSIRRVLRCPASLFLALSLVATASMAREYDAVSWWHHPKDLAGPFAASLMFGSILFVVILACLGSIGRKSQSVWRDYRVFMTGYWMTAPLAWLYAVPIEIMADEIGALRFNLTMLSIVSIWRVLLFGRVVAVQFGLPMLAVLPWITAPCMVIAFFAVMSSMLSMVSIMGGIRLTQTQQILVNYQSAVSAVCFYGIIPTLISGVVALVMLRGNWNRKDEVKGFCVVLDRCVWAWPIFAAIVLLCGASYFQPKLYHATKVESLLEKGDVVEAIEMMEQRGPSHFLPDWDPPPKFPDRDSQTPSVSVIVSAIEQTRCDQWIVDRLLVQADEISLRQANWYGGYSDIDRLEQQFPSYRSDQVDSAIDRLRALERIEFGGADAISQRTQMIEALLRVREKAIQEQSQNEAMADGQESGAR